jgi:glucose/arabinose dehydrogenase
MPNDRSFIILKTIVAALLIAACNGQGHAGVTGALAAQVSVPPLTSTITSIGQVTLGLQQVATGLDNPVFLTAPVGDPRQFIVERTGRIRILQNGQLQAAPFLDISDRVSSVGEGGLLSMAFHPQYASNGHFYIYYTGAGGDIVVERLTVSAAPNLADPASAREVIRIAHPGFTNHFGGLLDFGPDGDLYLGTGDGGSAGDPPHNAQNTGVLLGKLLRLDVNSIKSKSGAGYTIPQSNPFVGQAGSRAEIWAYGLRNPWRFTFDKSRLYIADVGQGRREEVNIRPVTEGGLNYGWNIREGSICYPAEPDTCASTGLTPPAFDYDHGVNGAGGCAIIGGYVYRGAAIPEVEGRYFYSDFCGGWLRSFYASAAGGVLEQIDWNMPKQDAITSFGRDSAGELYLISGAGTVSKIVRMP